MDFDERKLIEATKNRLKKREEFEARSISCYNNHFMPSISLGKLAKLYDNDKKRADACRLCNCRKNYEQAFVWQSSFLQTV